MSQASTAESVTGNLEIENSLLGILDVLKGLIIIVNGSIMTSEKRTTSSEDQRKCILKNFQAICCVDNERSGSFVGVFIFWSFGDSTLCQRSRI